MKKIIKYPILLLFSILVSCKKDCPPFNRDLLCWIPYSLGDTLKFINNRNDTISFGVYEKIIIDDNKKYGPCDKCGCWSEAFFYANSLQNSENTFYEGIVYVSATEIYFHISLNFNNRRGDFNLTTHHINENVIPSMIVDNQEYNDVIIFDNDTINDPNYSGFWRVIISKDIGFVKFYEKGSKNSWTRIN